VFAFERVEMYAKLIAELLLGEEQVAAFLATGTFPAKPGGVFGVLGEWPDGLVMDGSETLIAELANNYGIRFVKADRKPDAKVAGIEIVNGDLVDGRIKLIKDSPLEKQIRVLQWKEDDFGQKREDKAQANHSTDCLIYGRKLIAGLFESGSVVQEVATKKAESYSDPMGLQAEIPTEQPDEDSELLTHQTWSDDDEEW
jgi:hypothetical protein